MANKEIATQLLLEKSFSMDDAQLERAIKKMDKILEWSGTGKGEETYSEKTLETVLEILSGMVGVGPANDLISIMQNQGILFRERA